MNDDASQASLQPVTRPLDLIPVGLKEAALDSPTFRATAVHFAEQIEIIERWLDGYVKAASKLVAEVSSLEVAVNHFLGQSMPPSTVSEAVLDHDYSLLAMRRYGEGAREFWQYALRGIKRYDTAVVDPIKNFVNTELKTFKEARRVLEANQKAFDTTISRYSAQSKAKEASSLREDAFQLHEARKAYLKASMDFCVTAPQVRTSLDKLIVKIFSEQWKEMRASREANTTLFQKWGNEMERVRGWSREMENSERAFKRELLTARRQIEESASIMTKPSRELEDYAASTVPYLGTGASTATAPSSPAKPQERSSEKQSWLFQRNQVGKPARTVWNRRWFFVKNGIFGWLVQGLRSGGVEESEKIGVLLCGVRPAVSEERRFCFEVKTKDTTIVLQAETQHELQEWIAVFEHAKRKALEDPASTESSSLSMGVDPAFAISPPIAPEFAAKTGDAQGPDESTTSLTPSEPGVTTRSSFDVSALPAARRVMSVDKEASEGSRDHATRIIQKLDLHKRATASAQLSQGPAAGGIASLISASHNILPVGPPVPPTSSGTDGSTATGAARRTFTMPTSTLAPSTLANPPAPTNLSHAAVVLSAERGVGFGRADGSGMPSGIMANLWGSSYWGYVNRLGDDLKPQQRASSQPPSPGAMRSASASSVTQDDVNIMDGMNEPPKEISPLSPANVALGPRHRKTLSIANDAPLTAPGRSNTQDGGNEYPNYYPLPLKVQHAQFRMLFPTVPRCEKVVLVFRATWNPNEQQEFPGRVYVTPREVYFYSNHLGLVLITGVSLASITDITAAPGRDCDFLYLHLKERNQQDDLRRITVKVFLEPLRLLERRLNFLVRNANEEEPKGLEDVLKQLIKLEIEEPQRSSSVESWEDVTYDADNDATADQRGSPQHRRERNVKASLRIDGSLYADPARTGREVQKFKLPSQPVNYAPQGMQAGITRDFNVSAKALFHVMFGDKSAVFQLLYSNRWADNIVQTGWTKDSEPSAHWKRKFASQGHATPLADSQTIDIFNDHLCYVVTNTKVPWRLPYSSRFMPLTKIVITHSAKSKCKLAIFQQINWHLAPSLAYVKHLIEKQALNSLEADALDLTNVAMDQVAKLGSHSKTNRAVEIFGNIGQQTSVPQIDMTAVTNLGGSMAAGRMHQRKPMPLMRMVADDVAIRVLRMLGMLIDLLVAVGKQVLNICTAHTLLVVLLGFSALYNGWYGYRDGVSWYHERSATRFMARAGVRPDPMMSKALYLSDIDELISQPSVDMDNFTGLDSARHGKSCRSTFSEQLTTSTSIAAVKPTATRLHRTRDSLARYRHDLLVALRVVNRVERDVITAEFEDWVRAEERKCAKVESILSKRGRSSKGDKRELAQAAALDSELGEDFVEYCRSCRVDMGNIANGTRLM